MLAELAAANAAFAVIKGALANGKELSALGSRVFDYFDNNADIIKLMTNEIPCGEYRYAQSEVGLWYIEKGVGFTCRVSVPPDNHRFVGQITVGWAQQPESLEQIKFMLEIASAMLTKRGN